MIGIVSPQLEQKEKPVLQLEDATPFASTIQLLPDKRGVDTLYVIVKATFTISAAGALSLAEEQVMPRTADEFRGDPVTSSLKYASESHLVKPSTDIALVGQAWAKPGKKATVLDVELSVADCKQVVRVHGDRAWRRSYFIRRPHTAPVPFESMPIVYERAFGGVNVIDEAKQKIRAEGRNPVGVGYRRGLSFKHFAGKPLPNVEDPRELISTFGKKSRPVGFGFIPAGWLPRREFAGTYDEAWQKQRAPFLPDDFQDRFFNAAHPDLVCGRYLKGGESVRVVNASPVGTLAFALPECELAAEIKIAGVTSHPDLNLETVLIEPDDDRLCMTWRGAVSADKSALKTELIRVSLNGLRVDGRSLA